MTPTLSALRIATDATMRDNVLTGKKKISIREGHRNYHVGADLMICCHIVPFAVMATITNVRHTFLMEVTEDELRKDGFKDLKDLHRGLRTFYPNIHYHSPVTIIEWDNVHGRWVDDPSEFRYFMQEMTREQARESE